MKVIYGEARSPDIYYRCRWNSDVEVLYVEGEERRLFVPGFEFLRAKKEVLGDIRIEELKDLREALKSLSGEVKIPSRFPHGLVEHLGGPVQVEKELYPERRIKDADELAAIEAAQVVAAEAMSHAERILRQGAVVDGVLVLDGEPVTSEFLRAMIRSFLIHKGYDCPDVIVSSGDQTALPHHRGSGPIVEGPVIIDVFPQSERSRYHGDMTRTFIVGSDAVAERMLAAVRQVHDECVALCVPGAKVADIHAHAEERLAALGFSTSETDGLIHSLGHGLGLSVHERPNLSLRSEDVLEENMVVTIEPGLYYGVGVRHENVVIVRAEPVVLGLEDT